LPEKTLVPDLAVILEETRSTITACLDTFAGQRAGLAQGTPHAGAAAVLAESRHGALIQTIELLTASVEAENLLIDAFLFKGDDGLAEPARPAGHPRGTGARAARREADRRGDRAIGNGAAKTGPTIDPKGTRSARVPLTNTLDTHAQLLAKTAAPPASIGTAGLALTLPVADTIGL
jgi:hypothetical protein